MAVLTAPIATGGAVSRSGWRDLDWAMLLLVLVLAVWGCCTIASTTAPSAPAAIVAPARAGTARPTTATTKTQPRSSALSSANKQLIWVAVGLLLLFLMASIDYQVLIHVQWLIYFINLFLLTIVLIPHIGHLVNGARSWIPIGPFRLEPAEFTKVVTILTLAAFLSRRQEKIRDFSTVLWSLAYLAPSLLLILKQPNFGMTVAIFSIWFGMMFFGGARWQHLALVLGVGAALFAVAWNTDKIKPYQKERLSAFLDRGASPRGSGYHVNQSQIAIGSGQITGQGWGKGMQNHGGYVPENTTDFIFAVVAEDLGFVGAATLMLAYLLLLSRSTMLAINTDNYFGVLIAGGFTSLLAYHTVVNLGMTMHIMPITGVPLPFFSYGGSCFVTFSICVGLLQSIAMRRKRAF